MRTPLISTVSHHNSFLATSNFKFFLIFKISGREDRYTHEFVRDDDEEDGVDTNNDTLQQSFANFSQVAPRFSQMMEELQSSLCDEGDPGQHQHQHLLKGKMVPILSGEDPKHEHRDSGISGE